jgi:hypothetical protein
MAELAATPDSIERRLNSLSPAIRRAAMDEARILDSHDRILLCDRIAVRYRTGRLRQSQRSVAFMICNVISLGLLFSMPRHPAPALVMFVVWVLLLISTAFGVPTRAYGALPDLLGDSEDPQVVLAFFKLSYDPPFNGDKLDYYKTSREIAAKRGELERKLTSSNDRRLLPAFIETLTKTPTFSRTEDQRLLRVKVLEWLLEYTPTIPLNVTEKAPYLAVLQDPYRDAELTVAVLSAAARLELTSALDRISSLAHDSGATAHMLAVRSAAREALPHLGQARLRESRAETLVRPSSIPDAVPKRELLRAAVNDKPDAKPEELLRPDVWE